MQLKVLHKKLQFVKGANGPSLGISASHKEKMLRGPKTRALV